MKKHTKPHIKQFQRPKIILSAGGTGGHVFPATACASILQSQECDLILYTDTRGQKWNGILGEIPTYNISSSSVLGRGIRGKVRALFSIIRGFFQARQHLKKTEADIIVGFGGYATVPTVLAGASLGIKIVLHEQNAFAGRANRLLARFATTIATAFHKPLGLPQDKCLHTGNPVRSEIRDAYTPFVKPSDGVFNILITGGSQGAEIFGSIIPQALIKYKGHIRVVQQVRENQVHHVRKAYGDAGIDAKIDTFITDMASAYKNAHLTISRSGAGSVMENACVGIASILVPYKFSADNHQYYNALALEKEGGCICITQDNFTVESLQEKLDTLLAKKDGKKLQNMAQKAYNFSTPSADQKLANIIFDAVLKQ